MISNAKKMNLVLGVFLYRRLYRYCSWLLSCSYCSSSKSIEFNLYNPSIYIFKVHVHDLTDESNIDIQTEIDKMLCGIARIWVHPDHRRARIATKLLDCVR